MTEYLRAEGYKLTHRFSYTFGFLGIVLGGEALMLLLLKYASGGADNTFSDVVSVLPMMFSFGLYLAVAVCDMVFSDQYKQGTLKNEASYGLPRSRIYLGKLLAAALAAVAFCALILAFYVLLSRAMFPTGVGDDITSPVSAAVYLGRTLSMAFPAWLGALGFFHMLLFVTRGSTSATVIFVAVLFADQILDIMRLFLPKLEKLVSLIQGCSLNVPFDLISQGNMDLFRAWGVGMGWLAVSTVIGLVVFRKREIS